MNVTGAQHNLLTARRDEHTLPGQGVCQLDGVMAVHEAVRAESGPAYHGNMRVLVDELFFRIDTLLMRQALYMILEKDTSVIPFQEFLPERVCHCLGP